MLPESPASDPPDDALVARVQRGDLSAFEPLLDRHIHHLRGFLALHAPVFRLVDEITHETLVFAFRQIDQFRGHSFRAWLRAIAWNLLRAEIQRFSREEANQSRFLDHWLLENQAEEPGQGRKAEFLELCLQQVPADFQQLLALKYRDGRSSQEIAGKLQQSVAWVRVTLFRIRQQLKTCIETKQQRSRPC